MGARDRTPSVLPGLEAPECFEAYVAARRCVDRADRLLKDALAAADAGSSSMASPCEAPAQAGGGL
jgi:hypothetical protein